LVGKQLSGGPVKSVKIRFEQENSKLKRIVTNLSLEKLALKDIAEGNF
jgi:hypothetical protein